MYNLLPNITLQLKNNMIYNIIYLIYNKNIYYI